MAIHFGILARRNPQTKKPGRLQSMGSQESKGTETAHKETRTYEGDTNCSVLPLIILLPTHHNHSRTELAQEGCGGMEAEAAEWLKIFQC